MYSPPNNSYMSKGQKKTTSFLNLKPAMRKHVFQEDISDYLLLGQQYVFQGRATSRAGLDTFRPTYIQWSCACTMCVAWKALFPLASTKLSCRMRRFWWTGHTPSVKTHTIITLKLGSLQGRRSNQRLKGRKGSSCELHFWSSARLGWMWMTMTHWQLSSYKQNKCLQLYKLLP